MNPGPPCPPSPLLESLLLGQLRREEAIPLEEHLETCPECGLLASSLLAEDDLVHAMRAARHPPGRPEDTPVVETLARWLRRKPSAGTTLPPAPSGIGQGDTLPPREGAPDSAWAMPETLGPFRLERALGSGGMGVVFLAFDPRLKRQVAVKVIQPHHATNPALKDRFFQEARALAAVESDHIVTIHDVGQEAGSFYLAMPVLKGETLEARLKREKVLPTAEVLRIGREVAEGLAAAHARGLIHRDIKPANIWLEGPPPSPPTPLPPEAGGEGSKSSGSPSPPWWERGLGGEGASWERGPGGEGGRVKILDFGLACVVEDLADRSVPGGTPAFMAPEQAMGQPVDARADLFSLGCVLYVMAVGAPPFSGSDLLATLLQVATEDPPAPRRVNPLVPPKLEAMMLRLLAKNPEARPASAEEVRDALRDLETEGENRRRRRLRQLSFAAALLLALACAVAAYFLRPRPEPAPTTGDVTFQVGPDVPPVVLVREGEEQRLSLKSGDRHTLPAGDYHLRPDDAPGRLRLVPDSFTVSAGQSREVDLQVVGEEASYTGPGTVWAVAFAPAGGNLTLSGGGGDLRIAKWLAGKEKRPGHFLDGHEADVRSLAVSPDGKQAVSGEGGRLKTEDFAVWLWDLTRDRGQVLGTHPNWVTALAWLPKGDRVLAGDGDGSLLIWDIRTKTSATLPGAHRGRVGGVAVSPDGGKAVTGGDDGVLIVWGLAGRKMLHEQHLPQAEGAVRITGIALSADGECAYAAGSDGRIHAWDIKARKLTALSGHKGAVLSVAASACGERLLSAGADGTVRLWDLRTGEEIDREEHGGQAHSVALSAEGDWGLSGGDDRTVRLWRLPQSTKGRTKP